MGLISSLTRRGAAGFAGHDQKIGECCRHRLTRMSGLVADLKLMY